MATVIKRTIRSIPHRSAKVTWDVIVKMLTSNNVAGEDELMKIDGIMSSLVADKACEGSPIVVTCDGPRTRIFCCYDDDAIDDSSANEEPITHDPLNGDWKISVPCFSDDLIWVTRALEKITDRVTARDESAPYTASTQSSEVSSQSEPIINADEFRKL